MITISSPRGLMDNTISYERIASIAKAAQESGSRPGTGTDTIDHSRDMTFRERAFDYVFCGNAKKKFMDQLYDMVRNRKPEIRVKTGAAIVSCNSPERAQSNENFLIYRDNIRRTAIGIPLRLNRPLPNPDFPAASLPHFSTAAEIQPAQMQRIKKRGQLVVGHTAYDVRFTRKNGPVVMFNGETLQVIAIQRRLQNLWAINNVKQRLVDFRRRAIEPASTDPSKPCRYNQLPDSIRKRYASEIALLKFELDTQTQNLQDELDHFAKLTDPTWADKQAFQSLQKKISLLDDAKKRIAENVGYFSEQICAVCDRVAPLNKAELLELLEKRLVKFGDRMIRFFSTELSKDNLASIGNMRDLQLAVVSALSKNRYRHAINPRTALYWGQSKIHVPTYMKHRGAFLDLLNDPDTSWEQIKAPLERIRSIKADFIKLKMRQIEIGEELDRTLDSFIADQWKVQIEVRKVRFSAEYGRRIAFLVKMKNDLLNPDENFSESDLNAVGKEKDYQLALVQREFRARGFVPLSEQRGK